MVDSLQSFLGHIPHIRHIVTLVLKGRIYHFNPLTAGVADIRVLIFYYHVNYHLLNMLKIKYEINQQYLKTVDLHFVKSE